MTRGVLYDPALRTRAQSLRDEGLTYTDIGQRMGVGHAQAWHLVNGGRVVEEDRRRHHRRAQPDGTWRCSRCGECKPRESFGRTSRREGTPYSWCLACKQADRRARGIRPRLEPLVHPPGQKVCRACREAKPLDAFSPHAKSAFGRAARCRACNNAIISSSFRRCRNGMFAWEKKRDERLRRIYGITLHDFRLMLARQGGQCAICKHRFGVEPRRAIHVDHNHRTGRVRGLLCAPCNTALGGLRDDVGSLMRAARYLADDLFDKADAA